MKKTISIDWLQLYCSASQFTPHRDYQWLEKSFQTRHFRKQYEVVFRGELVATVQTQPTSNIIPADAMIIKFSNRELYGQNLYAMVHDFLDANNIIYKSITRIDIALDFNYFHGKIHPETFIRRFMTCEYLKIGRGKYALHGEQKFRHTFDYLRFGSKTSDLNVYLYNKTKELQQIHDKPYIREKWAKAGLKLDIPVWRLEISLKSKACQYVDLESGEHFNLKLDILDDLNYLYGIFYGLADQYFYFVINDNSCRKDRMKRLDLLDYSTVKYKPLYLPKEADTNKANKMFVKKLYQLDQELRNVPPEIQHAANNVLHFMCQSKELAQYVEKKSPEWQRDYYIPN